VDERGKRRLNFYRAKAAKAAKWANGTTVLKNPNGISAFSPVLVRQHLRRVIIPK